MDLKEGKGKEVTPVEFFWHRNYSESMKGSSAFWLFSKEAQTYRLAIAMLQMSPNCIRTLKTQLRKAIEPLS